VFTQTHYCIESSALVLRTNYIARITSLVPNRHMDSSFD